MTLYNLEPQEWRVVRFLADGSTQLEMAEEMGISRESVRTYIRRLCEEFDVPSAMLPETLGVRPSEIREEE